MVYRIQVYTLDWLLPEGDMLSELVSNLVPTSNVPESFACHINPKAMISCNKWCVPKFSSMVQQIHLWLVKLRFMNKFRSLW